MNVSSDSKDKNGDKIKKTEQSKAASAAAVVAVINAAAHGEGEAATDSSKKTNAMDKDLPTNKPVGSSGGSSLVVDSSAIDPKNKKLLDLSSEKNTNPIQIEPSSSVSSKDNAAVEKTAACSGDDNNNQKGLEASSAVSAVKAQQDAVVVGSNKVTTTVRGDCSKPGGAAGGEEPMDMKEEKTTSSSAVTTTAAGGRTAMEGVTTTTTTAAAEEATLLVSTKKKGEKKPKLTKGASENKGRKKTGPRTKQTKGASEYSDKKKTGRKPKDGASKDKGESKAVSKPKEKGASEENKEKTEALTKPKEDGAGEENKEKDATVPKSKEEDVSEDPEKKKTVAEYKYGLRTVVYKKFGDEWFFGHVENLVPDESWYSIRYEDGDHEELDEKQMDELVVKLNHGEVAIAAEVAPPPQDKEEDIEMEPKLPASSGTADIGTYNEHYKNLDRDALQRYIEARRKVDEEEVAVAAATQASAKENRGGPGKQRPKKVVKGAKYPRKKITSRSSRNSKGRTPIKKPTSKAPMFPSYELGTIVYKNFGPNWFFGYVGRIDTNMKLYGVVYEDGDKEEVFDEELNKIVVREENGIVAMTSRRPKQVGLKEWVEQVELKETLTLPGTANIIQANDMYSSLDRTFLIRYIHKRQVQWERQQQQLQSAEGGKNTATRKRKSAPPSATTASLPKRSKRMASLGAEPKGGEKKEEEKEASSTNHPNGGYPPQEEESNKLKGTEVEEEAKSTNDVEKSETAQKGEEEEEGKARKILTEGGTEKTNSSNKETLADGGENKSSHVKRVEKDTTLLTPTTAGEQTLSSEKGGLPSWKNPGDKEEPGPAGTASQESAPTNTTSSVGVTAAASRDGGKFSAPVAATSITVPAPKDVVTAAPKDGGKMPALVAAASVAVTAAPTEGRKEPVPASATSVAVAAAASLEERKLPAHSSTSSIPVTAASTATSSVAVAAAPTHGKEERTVATAMTALLATAKGDTPSSLPLDSSKV